MSIYLVMHDRKKLTDENAVERLIEYISDPLATAPGYIFGGSVSSDPRQAIASMREVQRAFGKESGVRIRHSVLAFSPREVITYRQVSIIAQEAIRFYSPQYQILASVHDNRPHPHVHFAMNTVSFLDGHKYPGTKQDLYDFIKFLNSIVRPICLHVKFLKKTTYYYHESSL